MGSCVDCKYHMVVNGFNYCVIRRHAYGTGCTLFERDWGFTIFFHLFIVVLFGMPVLLLLIIVGIL